MSDSISSPGSTSPRPKENNTCTWRDILLWRKKKKLNLSVLTASTLIWVVLEVYQFNFITIASWVSMAVITLIFLCGNIFRLLSKEPPKFSELKFSEDFVMNTAMKSKEYIEEGIKWMFRVSAEGEWFVFVKAVGGLLVLSQVGRFFDFITLLYMGLMIGMTVPVIYVKYEDKIMRSVEKIKGQGRRLYEKVDEKILKKVQNKLGFVEIKKETNKEKKIE